MKCLFLLCLITSGLLQGQIGAHAQEQLAPLNVNPHVLQQKPAPALKRTTALSLPFFEDFLGSDPTPDQNKFSDRQVYVNNTMGSGQISRGVATFDALSQYGIPYDTVNAFIIRYADSLTSRAIDLSGRTPGDSVYMSFFYQPGGNGFTPEKYDSLILYFRAKTGAVWRKMWAASDSVVKPFRQVMVRVSDTLFLHADFQFRFVNKASVGINDDVWNLDYIRINSGRNAFDTAVNDVAFTQTPTPLLNDYAAMPYRHYLAAASAERATEMKSALRNNFDVTRTISGYAFQAVAEPSFATIATDSKGGATIPAKSTQNISFNTYPATPSAGPNDRVVFRNKFSFSSPSADEHPENDSVTGLQIFDNYFAYDDGTAEMSWYLNLFPTLPGKLAIEYHLNTPDTLRGLAIYFGRQVPLASYKYVSLYVYKNIAYGGFTSDNVLYYEENVQPHYQDTVNKFWVYKFAKPVVLSAGTFFVGTMQPALSGSDSLYFGLDRNRETSNHAYYNVLGTWSPSTITGAIMVRPIVGAAISGSGVREVAAESKIARVYPSPAHDRIHIALPGYHRGASYVISSASGETKTRGSLQDEDGGIDIAELAAGAYLITVETDETHRETHTFIKQ